MSIEVGCPDCGQGYRLAASLAGKRVRCKKCGQALHVPDALPDPRPARDAATLNKRTRPTADRPSRARVEDGPLPPLISVPLILIGSLMGISVVALAVLSLSIRRPELAGIALALALGFACIAVCAYGAVKLLYMMYGEWAGVLGLAGLIAPVAILAVGKPPWGDTQAAFLANLFWLLKAEFLLLPIALIVHVVRHWKPAQYYAVSYIVGLVGFVSWCAQVPPYIQSIGDGGPNAPIHNTDTVEIVVSGISGDEVNIISEKLGGMADPGQGHGISGSNDGQSVRYNLFPVRDPNALARRVTFGKVTSVSGRTIYVTANPITADELAEYRRRKAEDQANSTPEPPNPAGAPAAEDSPVRPNNEDNSPFSPKSAKPPANDPVSRALAALDAARGDLFKRKQAVEALARLQRDEARVEEVADKLLRLLNSNDHFAAKEVMDALTVWTTPDVAPALAAQIRHLGLRHDACQALLKLNDPRASELLAAHMKDSWPETDKALLSIGAAAEPALIAQLRNPNDDVRGRVCEILGQIGGKETVLAIRALPADPDTFVRTAASDAVRKIIARVGPVRTPPKDASAKPKAKARR